MKKRILLTALSTLLATSALAQDFNVNGNVAAVSDYRNRGISRTDEGPALQGKIQLEHVIGLYAGVGGTNVDLNMDNDANVEGILFGGYKGNFDGIEYNGKLTYTAYTGSDADNLDYWEFELTGGYDFDVFYASLTWAISPDYINGSDVSLYYGGDITIPIQPSWSAKAHLGFQFVGDEGPYVTSNVTDWSAGLWYNWGEYDVDFGLEYTDTNLEDNECVENCGSTAVLTASKAFSW